MTTGSFQALSEIGLQLADRCDAVRFVEHGLLEALTDSVRLRALGLGAGVIDIHDREVEFLLVPLWIAIAATVHRTTDPLKGRRGSARPLITG
jgi:hypothetical protein